MAAFLRGLLMLVLGVLAVGAVLALLVVGFLGLSLRRVWRWMRGEPQPESGWQGLRNSAASAVWKQYQDRYQKSTPSGRTPVADVEDVDFRETPRTGAHTGNHTEIGRLPS